jgi:hypothetical protein
MTFKATGSIALLITSLATGCFLAPPSEKDEDTRSDFHDVTVRWHLRKLDGSVMAACPPGFTKLVTHLYKEGYVEPPDSIVRMPCTPEGSLTQPLATAGELLAEETRGDPVQAYYDYAPRKDIYLDVTEETEETFAAQTPTYYTELTADLTIDFDIYPEGGVGVSAWTLVSSLTTGKLASCAAAGVDEIEYAVRPFSDEAAPLVVGGSWPCDHADPYFYYSPGGTFQIPDADEYQLGVGHTKGYAPGEYFVELRAKRAGTVVGRSTSSMIVAPGNSAIRIHDDEITISDR